MKKPYNRPAGVGNAFPLARFAGLPPQAGEEEPVLIVGRLMKGLLCGALLSHRSAGQCYSVKRFTQAYVITTCAFFVCKKSLGLQKNIKTSKKGLTNPQKFEAPPVSKGTAPIVNKEDLL